jgi:tetratricopeptide (TPR) repeat protein
MIFTGCAPTGQAGKGSDIEGLERSGICSVKNAGQRSVTTVYSAANAVRRWRRNRSGKAPGPGPRKKRAVFWIIIASAAAIAIAAAGFLIWANTGERLADKQFARGEKFLEERSYDRAIMAFTYSIENGNTDVGVYLALSEAHMAIHDIEEAADILREGLAAVSEKDKILLELQLTHVAKSLLEERKYNEVIAALAGATAINPDDENAYLILGDAYMGLEDADRAAVILQEGMAAIPEDNRMLSALVAMCGEFLADENYESVIDALEGIAGPEDEDACFLLAEAYDGLGDTGKAIELLMDCCDATNSEKAETALEALLSRAGGNTPGNTVNTGIIAQQGDWIYYMDNEDFVLHKIRTDGTGRTRLCGDQSACLNVTGDVIYYRNYSDGGALYKIHTDGSGREKITSDSCYYVNVVNGWIYYYNYSDDGRLYKIRTDGTDRTRLNNDYSFFVTVIDDWIYYTDIYDVFKIRTDGTQLTRIIASDSICYGLVMDGDWLYFINNEEHGNICKVHTDGSRRTTLTGDHSHYFNIADGWIYFSNYSDGEKLYKVRTDGTGQTKLTDDPCHDIGIVEDWIYYINPNDEGCYYRVHMDGTGRERVD